MIWNLEFRDQNFVERISKLGIWKKKTKNVTERVFINGNGWWNVSAREYMSQVISCIYIGWKKNTKIL